MADNPTPKYREALSWLVIALVLAIFVCGLWLLLGASLGPVEGLKLAGLGLMLTGVLAAVSRL